MVYKESIYGENYWYCIGEETSISGTRLDYIYGFVGIGSPHGHTGIFNGSLVYARFINEFN